MSNDRMGPHSPTAASRHATAAVDPDPRVIELRRAIAQLRVELAGRRVHLVDRAAAEEELAALEAAAADGVLVIPQLRRALLVLTGALGSVSALALPLSQVHHAIDLFGPLTPAQPSAPAAPVGPSSAPSGPASGSGTQAGAAGY